MVLALRGVAPVHVQAVLDVQRQAAALPARDVVLRLRLRVAVPVGEPGAPGVVGQQRGQLPASATNSWRALCQPLRSPPQTRRDRGRRRRCCGSRTARWRRARGRRARGRRRARPRRPRTAARSGGGRRGRRRAARAARATRGGWRRAPRSRCRAGPPCRSRAGRGRRPPPGWLARRVAVPSPRPPRALACVGGGDAIGLRSPTPPRSSECSRDWPPVPPTPSCARSRLPFFSGRAVPRPGIARSHTRDPRPTLIFS